MTAPKDIVIFESTIVDDRSRGSAEHEFGADIAITATVGDTKVTIKNAIWVKRNGAGKGRMRVSDFEDLEEQINKMRQYACNPKVLLLDEYAGRRVSRVVSGNIILKERDTKGYSPENYFSARVLTTLYGNTDEYFMRTVQESSFRSLRIRTKYRKRS